MGNFHVKTVFGNAGLDEVFREWQSIYLSISSPTLSHDWRWIATLAESLYQNSLMVNVVYSGVYPVAIFYFWRGQRQQGPLHYFSIESPTSAEFVVLSDALIRPNYLHAPLLKTVLDSLRKNRKTRWDVFSASNCTERSLINQLLESQSHLESTENSNAFVLCRTPNDLKVLARKQVRNVRRFERKAVIKFRSLSLTVSNRHTVDNDFDKFMQIEDSGWKGADGKHSSIRSSGGHAVNFYHTLIARFGGSDDVQIYHLKFGSDIAASAIALINGSVLQIFKIAYNETYKPYSPGSILLLKLFEAMAESDDIVEVNLLTNPEWCRRWHMFEVPVNQIRFYSFSLKATSFRLMRALKQGVEFASKNIRRCTKWIKRGFSGNLFWAPKKAEKHDYIGR